MGNKKNKRSHRKLKPWAHRKLLIEKCAAMVRRKATGVSQTEQKSISNDDNTTTSLWLKKMQQPKNANTPKPYVCAGHFDEKYINLNTSRKRLKKAAVPTRDLPNISQDSDGMIDSDEASHSYNTFPAKGLDTCLVPVKVEQIDNNPSTSSSDINEIFQYEVPTKIVQIKEEKDCLTVFTDEDKEDRHHEVEIIANQYIYDITLVNPII